MTFRHSDDPPAEVRHGLCLALKQPDSAIWTRLYGGRTNQSWKVETGTDCIVVKLFAPGNENPVFPNNATLEAAALRSLSGRSFAPECLAVFDTPLGPCIAYRHVAGTPWSRDAAEVGRLMRNLHNVTPIAEFPQTDVSPSALVQQALSMAPELATDIKALPPTPSLSATPDVFLHGDIVAGNLIRSATGLVLIDWQCPAIGDPCHDIAVFLSPAMMQLYRGSVLDAVEIAAFFNGYGSDTLRDRYHRLAPWFHIRMIAYCRWKSARGEADYRQAEQVERATLAAALDDQVSQSRMAKPV